MASADHRPRAALRLPRERAGRVAKGAGANARLAGSALVDAVGALVDQTIHRVLLRGDRVTSAAEGKRLLEGEVDVEARADAIQKVVVLAVPAVRVLARGARVTRLPWVMIASSAITTGVAVRSGVRELQVLASLVAHRLERASGAPADPALVERITLDLYLAPKRPVELGDDSLHLARLARRWIFSGAFGRNTSRKAAKALDAAERLDGAALVARWTSRRL